jgi:hypothetical protein
MPRRRKPSAHKPTPKPKLSLTKRTQKHKQKLTHGDQHLMSLPDQVNIPPHRSTTPGRPPAPPSSRIQMRQRTTSRNRRGSGPAIMRKSASRVRNWESAIISSRRC